MIDLPIVLGSAFAAPSFPAADEAASALAPLSALTAAALLQEEEEEAPDGTWHGNVNIGLSKSEGNANVESYNLDARAVREFEEHRYTLDALWFFQRDKDGPGNGILQRRALGSAKYDQFLSEKMYFWGNVLAETNLRAILDLRWTVGGGIGYQWRDDDQVKFNTEAGLAYFNEEFDNGDKFDYLAARLAWDFWARVTETVVFGHIAELFPSLDDKDDVYGRANTYFEAQLSERMTARLSWVANYDNTPATVGGQTLKRLDSLYLLTVGWTF
jgi:putative salt-induced outer membrane protein YdiY